MSILITLFDSNVLRHT